MIGPTFEWARVLGNVWNLATKVDDPPHPILPQTRPRVLTPSPSRESLVESAASATANSAFFQKLPPEIRLKILREAFGDRTIHMDLYFDYPMKPLSERQPNRTQRVGGARIPPPQPQWGIARAQRKKWQWLSGECYRSSYGLVSDLVERDLDDDSCFPGMTDCCEIFHTSIGVRQIGVMGWLLSCRQAYAECIDVLYATNTMYMTGNALFQELQDVRYGPGTIHMAGPVLPRLLPNVLLPKRLASITSVRIRWTCRPFESEPYEPSLYGLSAFTNFLKDLPRLFPHLRKLHLSLEGKMTSSPHVERDRLVKLIESDIMIPVDGMVRNLGPQMQKCCIAISASLYFAMRYKPLNPGQQLSPQERHEWLYAWRELPASNSTSSHQSAHMKGYAIRIGQLDMPVQFMIPPGYGDF
ncbi:hypothetical protein VE00_01715 [Pseudogymnoascus sp. WSF 3629]|nr:hypothetical protein VE00_01715 [Pseudogymnoascus sp. WSF 3629]